MKKILLVFSLSLFLSGCNLIDEYYVYDINYLSEMEKTFGEMKNVELRKDVIEVFKSTQIRIKLSPKPKMTLLVIESGKYSDELKNRLSKIITDFSSKSETFDTCDYVNDRNWICKELWGGWEMKDGNLYNSGKKLIHRFTLQSLF
jgi:hypothetical protein